MQHSDEKSLLCFICRSKKTRRGANYRSIGKSFVPNSKKPLKAVLLHLAKFVKSELKVPPDARVCQRCYRDLVEYDDFVLKLLEVQRRLTKMIEKSLNERRESPVSLSSGGDDNVFMESLTKHDAANDDVDVDEEEEEELSLADIRASLRPIDEEEISLPSIEIKLESENDIDGEDEEELTLLDKKKKERRTYGTKDKGATCTVCGLKLKDDEYLELHMNLHEGKTETECRYCDKRFSRKRNVLRHMQVHWDKKKFQCDKCGLCFKQQIILWNHKQHHEAEKQPPRCDICNMVFKTKRTYTHHMGTHRPDRPRYSCEYCGKTFTEKYTLKVHKRTHPEMAGATPSEQIQQQQQQPSPDEQQQMVEEVETTLLFKCIICNLQFTNKDVLNKHMEREHDVITQPLTITNFSQYEVVVEHEPRRRAKSGVDHHLVEQISQDISYLQ